jgi:hypothetical protein
MARRKAQEERPDATARAEAGCTPAADLRVTLWVNRSGSSEMDCAPVGVPLRGQETFALRRTGPTGRQARRKKIWAGDLWSAAGVRTGEAGESTVASSGRRDGNVEDARPSARGGTRGRDSCPLLLARRAERPRAHTEDTLLRGGWSIAMGYRNRLHGCSL